MGDGPKDIRDRALLLIGFAGALRRSELVSLDVADIDHVRRGLTLHLRHSKTDQDGQGDKIAIPFGRSRCCPVLALDAWLSAVRHQQRGRYSGRSTATAASMKDAYRAKLSRIVVRRESSGCWPRPIRLLGRTRYGRGSQPAPPQAGVPTWRIRAQTRHASDVMMARYIRQAELFDDNAAGVLL